MDFVEYLLLFFWTSVVFTVGCIFGYQDCILTRHGRRFEDDDDGEDDEEVWTPTYIINTLLHR